jgi:hypothetical protein
MTQEPRLKTPSSISKQITFPSEADEDRVFVSFGLIISCRLSDADKIRLAVESARGRIVFQTLSNGSLFLLRQAQIENALSGNLEELIEINKKKERRLETK